jgi:hypothetical protein
MGDLRISRLGEDEVKYWLYIDELRLRYNQLRFGLELVDNGYGKKVEKGGIQDFISRMDYKSKSKTELEILRRSVRDLGISDRNRYNKLNNQKKIINKTKWEDDLLKVKMKVRLNENIILGKFLYFDIFSNYLVKVDFGGLEIICYYKCIGGMNEELLNYIKKYFLYNYEYDGNYGHEKIAIYLSKFFRKGLVDSKEYKGVVHSFNWYLDKIREGEILVRESGEYKSKIIENFYPIISLDLYNDLIYRYKNSKEGIFKFVGY